MPFCPVGSPQVNLRSGIESALDISNALSMHYIEHLPSHMHSAPDWQHSAPLQHLPIASNNLHPL